MEPSTSLAAATVAIYALAALPTIYILIRHGSRGLAFIGWGYLFLFCTLKMIGSGMQLNDASNTGASIVTSIGLSPLLLAVAGVLHEARFHRAGSTSHRKNQKTEIISLLLYHFLIATGIALVAVGASGAANAKTNDEADKAYTKAKAGAVVLLLGWLGLVAQALRSGLSGHKRVTHQTQHDDGTRLLLGVLVSLPFLGIRVVMSLVAFATRNRDLNGATGSVGVRIGLYFVEELVVTLVLIGMGIVTRNVRRHIV